ncbi:hypothetical protein FACS1894208_00780 [Clostridia bacterium]|nr:hypothetical protein FACS1894208_00780 [Clostridia bacterium]
MSMSSREFAEALRREVVRVIEGSPRLSSRLTIGAVRETVQPSDTVRSCAAWFPVWFPVAYTGWTTLSPHMHTRDSKTEVGVFVTFESTPTVQLSHEVYPSSEDGVEQCASDFMKRLLAQFGLQRE